MNSLPRLGGSITILVLGAVMMLVIAPVVFVVVAVMMSSDDRQIDLSSYPSYYNDTQITLSGSSRTLLFPVDYDDSVSTLDCWAVDEQEEYAYSASVYNLGGLYYYGDEDYVVFYDVPAGEYTLTCSGATQYPSFIIVDSEEMKAFYVDTPKTVIFWSTGIVFVVGLILLIVGIVRVVKLSKRRKQIMSSYLLSLIHI